MIAVTQVSGNIHPDNKAFHALVGMLTQLGIYVARSPQNEPSFYETELSKAWQQYNNEIAFYESIADSSFHIIYNDDAITNEVGTQILYAILKGRPIVMTGALVFKHDINPFVRGVVIEHLHHFHSVKLAELELNELDTLLRQLKKTDYKLSRGKTTLIHAHIKAHFRALLESAKAIRSLA